MVCSHRGPGSCSVLSWFLRFFVRFHQAGSCPPSVFRSVSQSQRRSVCLSFTNDSMTTQTQLFVLLLSLRTSSCLPFWQPPCWVPPLLSDNSQIIFFSIQSFDFCSRTFYCLPWHPSDWVWINFDLNFSAFCEVIQNSDSCCWLSSNGPTLLPFHCIFTR